MLGHLHFGEQVLPLLSGRLQGVGDGREHLDTLLPQQLELDARRRRHHSR